MILSPWLQFSLEMHEERIEEELSHKDEASLTHLSFSRKEFQSKLEWIEENEFIYRGMMYDLLEMEIKGDRIELTVYADEEEKRMKEKHHALREHEQKGKNKRREASGHLQPFKYYEGQTYKVHSPLQLSYTTLIPQALPLLMRALEVPTPPPCSFQKEG